MTASVRQGRAGAALCLLLLLGIGFYTLKGATHFVNRIRRLAHSRTRLMISAAAFAVGALALLSFLRLPYDVRGGYVVVGGHTELALPPGTDTAAVTAGSSVSLQEAGLALRSTVGRATIAGPGAAGRVAMSVFVPVRSSGVTMPAQLYPLADVEGNDLRATGAAVVHEGSRPLGSWLVGRYVSPVLRSLAG